MQQAKFQETGERIRNALTKDDVALMKSFFEDYYAKAKEQCAQHFRGQGEEWIRNYRQHLQDTFGDRLTKCDMSYTPEPDVARTPIGFPKMAPPVSEDVTKTDPLYMLKGHQTIFHLCAYYNSSNVMTWVLSDQFKKDYPMCVLPSLEEKNTGNFSPAYIAIKRKSSRVLDILKEKVPQLRERLAAAAAKKAADKDDFMPGIQGGFFK